MGIVKIVRGWQQKVTADMDLPSDRSAHQLTVRLHQVGSIAKGASIGLIGVLVVIAAIRFGPDEASGLDAALKALAAQPCGVFCLSDARDHRV